MAAGYAISAFGVNRSFLFQAVVVLITALLAVQLPSRKRDSLDSTDFREGINFILTSRKKEGGILLYSAVLTAFICGCGMTVFFIAPFYMMTTLRLSAETVGQIFFLEAIVAFPLTLFVKHLTRKFGSGQIFPFSTFLCATSIFVSSMARSPSALVVGFSLGAVGISSLRITYNNLCHLLSPLRIRGSVLGIHEALMSGSIPAAAIIFSFMAKNWGYQRSYLIMGIFSLSSFMIYFFSPLRGLKVKYREDSGDLTQAPALSDAV